MTLYAVGERDDRAVVAQERGSAPPPAGDFVSHADRTVQILGGDGITKEYGRAEQIYRDARALPIVGGTSEMAKYLIAAIDLPSLKPNL